MPSNPPSKYRLSRTPIPVSVFQSSSRRNDNQSIKTKSLSSSQGITTTQTTPATTTMSSRPTFTTPPPSVSNTLLTFPRPSILLVTLNRPAQLNCINTRMHLELDALFKWMDAEPSLICGIVTGAGRAFCAGADLKEWNGQNTSNGNEGELPRGMLMPPSGFGAMSRRSGKKPLIAAVNGLAFGGGTEIVVNMDIVIAAESARFALPEVKRGVIALAGALTRLGRTVGRQRAMEMALLGRTYGAREMKEWGLVNCVVPDAKKDANEEFTPVVAEAIRWAEEMGQNSPDSVICSREGIKMAWEGVGAEEGTRKILEDWYPKMDRGKNMIEGVRAFAEKRAPKWVASKL